MRMRDSRLRITAPTTAPAITATFDLWEDAEVKDAVGDGMVVDCAGVEVAVTKGVILVVAVADITARSGLEKVIKV
jgi:hypothetical protein